MMDKQELLSTLRNHINKEKEKRENADSDTWISGYGMGRVDALTLGYEKVEQLDEPEKPEIPKFVADWIEHIRETNKHGDGFVGINGEDIFRVIIDMGQVSSMFPVSDLSINDYEITDELVDWCSGHETEFLRALIDGYTIEKQPVWVVLKDAQYFHAFTGEYDESEGFEYVLAVYEEHAHTFTDKQKAEAVATLVDGTFKEWSE